MPFILYDSNYYNNSYMIFFENDIVAGNGVAKYFNVPATPVVLAVPGFVEDFPADVLPAAETDQPLDISFEDSPISPITLGTPIATVGSDY
jgi:hypothetical protein